MTNDRKPYFAERHRIALIVMVLALCAVSLAQTQPATPSSPHRNPPELATPQQAAAAYYRAIAEEDGELFADCIDIRNDAIKEAVAARAAELSASGHFRSAARSKFGAVAPQLLPTAPNVELMQLLMNQAPNAIVTIEQDRAVLTPVLPHTANESDMGENFRMVLSKTGASWRIVLQDSASIFKLQTEPPAKADIELRIAYAAATQAVATEIDQGRFTDSQEAAESLKDRKAVAQAEVLKRLQAEKKSRAATNAATQPLR